MLAEVGRTGRHRLNRGSAQVGFGALLRHSRGGMRGQLVFMSGLQVYSGESLGYGVSSQEVGIGVCSLSGGRLGRVDVREETSTGALKERPTGCEEHQEHV